MISTVAPRYGGPSQAVIEMTHALSRAGLKLLIATTDADGPGGHLSVALGTLSTFRDSPVIFFRRQWSESFMVSLPLAGWIRDHVAEFDAVHLHGVFTYACLVAASACRRQGVPYVVRPLGTLDLWSRRQKPLRKWVMWQLAARRMLSGAAAVHYTSAEERADVEARLGLRRGVVIPLGVDERLGDCQECAGQFRSEQPLLGNHPYVLVLCRIHPVKRLELCLDAFIDVTNEPAYRDWHLVIAGGGDVDYTASLVGRATGRGAAERIHFTGWLDGTAKQGALSGASLLMLASQHENFGVSVAEALICGVPVLVSDQVQLVPEIAAAGAGWVTPVSQVAVASALREALGDRTERLRRGEAGHLLALERYSWRRVAADLERLYESVTRRAQAPAA